MTKSDQVASPASQQSIWTNYFEVNMNVSNGLQSYQKYNIVWLWILVPVLSMICVMLKKTHETRKLLKKITKQILIQTNLVLNGTPLILWRYNRYTGEHRYSINALWLQPYDVNIFIFFHCDFIDRNYLVVVASYVFNLKEQ